MDNPWVRTPAVATISAEDNEPTTHDAIEAWQPLGHSEPVSTLPIIEVDDCTSPWFVGAHGGAGTSTLATLCRGKDAGMAWPVADSGTRTIVVARSNMQGLRAAQRVALQWMSGAVPSVDLLGVVFVSDSGGREPKKLKEFRRFVSGAFPKAWYVPWVEGWRMIDSIAEANVPRAVRKVTVEICEQTERSRP